MSTPADQTTSRLTFDLLPFLCTLPGRVAKLECENEYLKRDKTGPYAASANQLLTTLQ